MNACYVLIALVSAGYSDPRFIKLDFSLPKGEGLWSQLRAAALGGSHNDR